MDKYGTNEKDLHDTDVFRAGLLFFLHRQMKITTEASIAATIGSVMAKILATPVLVLPVNKWWYSVQDKTE